MSRIISAQELAQHGPSSSEPWVLIDGSIFNVKSFASLHPGGEAVLLAATG
jgi:cytochrome b involved in lipid metabolism